MPSVKYKYNQHNQQNGDKNQKGNKPGGLVDRSWWNLRAWKIFVKDVEFIFILK